MSVIIQMRRDTSANWEVNKKFILRSGEIGFNITENKLKIGDGKTPWDELNYIQGEGAANLDIINSNISSLSGNILSLSSTINNLGIPADPTSDINYLSSVISPISSDIYNVSTGVITKLNSLESKVSTNSNKISSSETTITNIKSDITTLQNLSDSNKTNINDISSEVSSNINSISNVEKDISNISSNINTISSEVSSNINSISNVEKDISNISSNINTISNSLSGYSKKLHTHKFTDIISSDDVGIESITLPDVISSLSQSIVDNKNSLLEEISNNKQSISDNASNINDLTSSTATITKNITSLSNTLDSKLDKSLFDNLPSLQISSYDNNNTPTYPIIKVTPKYLESIIPKNIDGVYQDYSKRFYFNKTLTDKDGFIVTDNNPDTIARLSDISSTINYVKTDSTDNITMSLSSSSVTPGGEKFDILKITSLNSSGTPTTSPIIYAKFDNDDDGFGTRLISEKETDTKISSSVDEHNKDINAHNGILNTLSVKLATKISNSVDEHNKDINAHNGIFSSLSSNVDNLETSVNEITTKLDKYTINNDTNISNIFNDINKLSSNTNELSSTVSAISENISDLSSKEEDTKKIVDELEARQQENSEFRWVTVYNNVSSEISDKNINYSTIGGFSFSPDDIPGFSKTGTTAVKIKEFSFKIPSKDNLKTILSDEQLSILENASICAIAYKKESISFFEIGRSTAIKLSFDSNNVFSFPDFIVKNSQTAYVKFVTSGLSYNTSIVIPLDITPVDGATIYKSSVIDFDTDINIKDTFVTGSFVLDNVNDLIASLNEVKDQVIELSQRDPGIRDDLKRYVDNKNYLLQFEDEEDGVFKKSISKLEKDVTSYEDLYRECNIDFKSYSIDANIPVFCKQNNNTEILSYVINQIANNESESNKLIILSKDLSVFPGVSCKTIQIDVDKDNTQLYNSELCKFNSAKNSGLFNINSLANEKFNNIKLPSNENILAENVLNSILITPDDTTKYSLIAVKNPFKILRYELDNENTETIELSELNGYELKCWSYDNINKQCVLISNYESQQLVSIINKYDEIISQRAIPEDVGQIIEINCETGKWIARNSKGQLFISVSSGLKWVESDLTYDNDKIRGKFRTDDYNLKMLITVGTAICVRAFKVTTNIASIYSALTSSPDGSFVFTSLENDTFFESESDIIFPVNDTYCVAFTKGSSSKDILKAKLYGLSSDKSFTLLYSGIWNSKAPTNSIFPYDANKKVVAFVGSDFSDNSLWLTYTEKYTPLLIAEDDSWDDDNV